MAPIAIGVLGALLAARWSAIPRRTMVLLGALGTLGLLAVLFAGAALWHVLRDGYLLVLALSTLCLLLAFDRRAAVGEWQPWRALAWVRSWGRLSYEIYLTHMFVVYGVVRLFRWSGGDHGRGVLWYLLALPACWLLGAVVARHVSVPGVRWLRLRATRRGPSAEAPALLQLPVESRAKRAL
jgi:peptidoglycan/LPS O-acetylase OafA/YrhL